MSDPHLIRSHENLGEHYVSFRRRLQYLEAQRWTPANILSRANCHTRTGWRMEPHRYAHAVKDMCQMTLCNAHVSPPLTNLRKRQFVSWSCQSLRYLRSSFAVPPAIGFDGSANYGSKHDKDEDDEQSFFSIYARYLEVECRFPRASKRWAGSWPQGHL